MLLNTDTLVKDPIYPAPKQDEVEPDTPTAINTIWNRRNWGQSKPRTQEKKSHEPH